MMARIAVLHTSFVFVSVEPMITDLIGELVPSATLIHLVDSDLLASVVRDGRVSQASERRMTHLAQAAEAAEADIIFSACSSLGPALDVAARHVGIPVLKIDDAMAEDAAQMGRRIGVLATVPTTIGPTSSLIRAKARDLGRSISIEERLCRGAFDILMTGDRERHDAMVLQEARSLAAEVDLVVLAQASMARLADPIARDIGRPVLSSPRRGVEKLAKQLADQSRKAPQF